MNILVNKTSAQTSLYISRSRGSLSTQNKKKILQDTWLLISRQYEKNTKGNKMKLKGKEEVQRETGMKGGMERLSAKKELSYKEINKIQKGGKSL